MDAYFNAFARAFDYSGRSTRSEYWLFQLGWLIVALIVFFLVGWFAPRLVVGRVNVVNVGLLLVHLLPWLALTSRRLHDSGHRAGWLAWLLLPGLGAIVLLFMSLARPDEGENEFGPDPRLPEARESGRHFEPTAEPPREPAILPVAELEKLQQLRASGAIDDEEFANLKARVMARIAK